MTSGRPRAAVLTLGCRVNQYESEAIETELVSLGFEIGAPDTVCDVYIINTCAVTGESERKSRQLIRRASSLNPAAFVLVTGCFSQIHAEEAAKIPGVDYVCGSRNKLSAAEMAVKLFREGGKGKPSCAVSSPDGAAMEVMNIPHAYRDRCFIKVEDGCDNACTYCIIRKARGSVVSRPPEEVLAEVKNIAADGCREVILTGIEAASYGRDFVGERKGYSLAHLLAETAAVEGIERVRTGSLEPSVMTKDFCDTLAAAGRVMPSFHLSLQSGSDAVLAAMKRKYNRTQVLHNVAYMKSIMPGVTFTCDIIVGFPGETEEDFRLTMALAEEIGFLHMHIFPFSAREGTPAAEMKDQIPEATKRERARRLEALGRSLSEKIYRAAIGSRRRVLFESRMGDSFFGHAEDMLEIYMKTEEDLGGRIFDVRLVSYDGGRMTAELIAEVPTDSERGA